MLHEGTAVCIPLFLFENGFQNQNMKGGRSGRRKEREEEERVERREKGRGRKEIPARAGCYVHKDKKAIIPTQEVQGTQKDGRD